MPIWFILNNLIKRSPLKQTVMTLIYNNAAGHLMQKAVTIYSPTSTFGKLLNFLPSSFLGSIGVGFLRGFCSLQARISTFGFWNYLWGTDVKKNIPKVDEILNIGEKLKGEKLEKLQALKSLTNNDESLKVKLLGEIEQIDKNIASNAELANSLLEKVHDQAVINNLPPILNEVVQPVQLAAVQEIILNKENLKNVLNRAESLSKEAQYSLRPSSWFGFIFEHSFAASTFSVLVSSMDWFNKVFMQGLHVPTPNDCYLWSCLTIGFIIIYLFSNMYNKYTINQKDDLIFRQSENLKELTDIVKNIEKATNLDSKNFSNSQVLERIQNIDVGQKQAVVEELNKLLIMIEKHKNG